MIPPGATLGLIGGGQLGRMFTLRALAMGYEVAVLDPDPESPAGAVATTHLKASYDDPDALVALAQLAQAVTTEFENVPADALEQLAETTICRPAAGAVRIGQDRIREKEFLRSLGLATADFVPVRSAEEVAGAWDQLGSPALLKTSRLGYDGKGQVSVDRLAEALVGFAQLGSVPCVLERRLELEREISVVLARDSAGAVATFPVSENVHRNGILFTTVVPARIAPALATEADRLARQVADTLDYVGVMAVEMFVAKGGTLSINEIAPRPHNSGHYTLDAATTDQFEQQLRALVGLPLGDPGLLSPVCMVNLLGDLWRRGQPPWHRALALPGVTLHLYGKRTPRPGRKMGHLNCLAPDQTQAEALALRAYTALQETGTFPHEA